MSTCYVGKYLGEVLVAQIYGYIREDCRYPYWQNDADQLFKLLAYQTTSIDVPQEDVLSIWHVGKYPRRALVAYIILLH